ncbi:hypothetical protein D9K79_11440 [Acinetobacter cumulans]|uniref:Uncharacterized protein n=1 Tax=Acinetobacter cumulans TaxID=2136182 RepID=A0ABX9U4J8_9GAMM|nr:hypothetical protein [Acinetobacter cumulans]RLL42973.1 hypothetical protein D9K79_11440 [Acinetobacter cumulans]
MSDFEKWFEDQDFYANMRFIYGDKLFDKDGDVYRVLPVHIAFESWFASACTSIDHIHRLQRERDQLKTQLNNMEACYIEKKKELEELQTENTEPQEVVLRDGALATKAQLERNEWQEVVKSQQKTIENLSVRHEVLNIQVYPAHQLKLTEKVSKEISRGSRLTKHRIDLRG